jgi:hypothetical protein
MSLLERGEGILKVAVMGPSRGIPGVSGSFAIFSVLGDSGGSLFTEATLSASPASKTESLVTGEFVNYLVSPPLLGLFE